jgi:hypothetical protein
MEFSVATEIWNHVLLKVNNTHHLSGLNYYYDVPKGQNVGATNTYSGLYKLDVCKYSRNYKVNTIQ